MEEWKNIFEDTYSLSKETFENTKYLIYKISIIMAILTTLLIAVSMFDLQSQGASFLESLSSKNINYNNSGYIFIANILFNILSSILYFTLFVYFFFKITKNEKNISKSFSYFLNKLLPLFITWIIYIILIVPLFILLIIPGIIFSILWMFFTHSVLFRDKNYYSALAYSKSLVSGKKLDTLNNFLAFFFRMWKYWLFLFLLIIVISFTLNNYTYLLGQFIGTIFLNIFTFYGIIFSISYFLNIEKRNGISNELIKNKVNLSKDNINNSNTKIS